MKLVSAGHYETPEGYTVFRDGPVGTPKWIVLAPDGRQIGEDLPTREMARARINSDRARFENSNGALREIVVYCNQCLGDRGRNAAIEHIRSLALAGLSGHKRAS